MLDYKAQKFEEVLEHKSFDVVFDVVGEAARMMKLGKKGITLFFSDLSVVFRVI